MPERRVVPGQLWRWAFAVNDGWWPWQRVTTAGRTGLDSSVAFARRGDLFTVMVVDDPGPHQLPDLSLGANGTLVPTVVRRWHVVLLRDALYWLDHTWLDTSELVCDVP